MKTIIVVSALIHDSVGNVLLAKRRPDSRRPSLWEFPGGKVEPGEMEREALVRECREELGASIVPGRLLSTATLTVESRLHLLLFDVPTWRGRLNPLASTELTWAPPERFIEDMPMSPATYVYHEDVMDFLRPGWRHPGDPKEER